MANPLDGLPQSAQLEKVVAQYKETDITDERQRQSLADLINASTLPRYYKEVLMAVFLAPSGEEVTLALHLLRSQEILRHADALNAMERRALAERLQRLNR